MPIPAAWQCGAGERQRFTVTGSALAATAAFLPAQPRRHRFVALSRCGPPATAARAGRPDRWRCQHASLRFAPAWCSSPV